MQRHRHDTGGGGSFVVTSGNNVMSFAGGQNNRSHVSDTGYSGTGDSGNLQPYETLNQIIKV